VFTTIGRRQGIEVGGETTTVTQIWPTDQNDTEPAKLVEIMINEDEVNEPPGLQGTRGKQTDQSRRNPPRYRELGLRY
jgi:hypothetical protein